MPSKKIIRPKFEFSHEIEENAWEFGVEEYIIPSLKEEMKDARKGKRSKEIKYLYGCPYCSFKSEFFSCVDLHIVYSKSCYKRSKVQPCYPINLCKKVKA